LAITFSVIIPTRLIALIGSLRSLTIQVRLIVCRFFTIKICRVKIAEFESAPIVVGFKILPHLHDVRTVSEILIVLVVTSHDSFLPYNLVLDK
jgi:hypothetical protein